MYNNYKPPLGGKKHFMIQKQADGARHAYCDGSIRVTDLSRLTSNTYDAWSSFANLGEAYCGDWNMSTDPEFDPFKFDNARFHAYKARSSGGAGWVKSRAVAYAEACALNPNPNWPYLEADCANFTSQARNYAGMDANCIDRSNWYVVKNMNGAWIWGFPWTVAADFRNYFINRAGGYYWNGGTYSFNASLGAYPYNTNTSINNGDLLSFDWGQGEGTSLRSSLASTKATGITGDIAGIWSTITRVIPSIQFGIFTRGLKNWTQKTRQGFASGALGPPSKTRRTNRVKESTSRFHRNGRFGRPARIDPAAFNRCGTRRADKTGNRATRQPLLQAGIKGRYLAGEVQALERAPGR